MLTVRHVTSDDLPTLFQYWCDLETLRSSLYRTSVPMLNQQAWTSSNRHSMGWVVEASNVVGSLLYERLGGVAFVRHLLVDLHTTQTRAIGAALWREAVSAWREMGIKQVEACAEARLPVEEAFWYACGARQVEGRYVVRLC